MTAEVSSQAEDRAWDDFLQATPLGQFQQSSAWSQVKVAEGWNVLRASVKIENRIIGGFQLLWRRSRIGRIGYVSKGPVLPGESGGLIRGTLSLLDQVARDTGLSALVVQPPDASQRLEASLRDQGLVEDRVMDVIRHSLVVDVSGGPEAVRNGLNRTRRKEIRRARKRGTVIREGGAGDLPVFFALMRATCARQGERRPNPGSVDGLQRLHDALGARGWMRLTLAEWGGRPLAGMLAILFGGRMTLWKKGWNGECSEHRPNDLLTLEMLEWAAQRGLREVDFGSLEAGLARAMIDGREFTARQQASRTFFNVGFGGRAVVLPPATIWFASPWARTIYRCAAAIP
ncbi:MAG TPA: GNAT family N-acetyltransferase, partial [Methylomirabilota bacterium]|nr:GNAT family N-acetyltransferase [Methylomirabilota bacterium]